LKDEYLAGTLLDTLQAPERAVFGRIDGRRAAGLESVEQGAREVFVFQAEQILERGSPALGCENLGELPSRGLSLEHVLDRPLGIFGLCRMDEQQGVE